MRRFAHAAIALFIVSGASVAQQPLTYPGRSQGPAQQAVDTAACYADANKTTHVNMAHESQRPPPPSKVADAAPRPIIAPVPLNPPLPSAAGASGASAATAASAPAGASGTATAQAASGASGVATPTTAAAASGASATLAASGAAPASGALAASGASMPVDGSASLAAMPPPPPPEPPMVRYWAAYSKCMQQRGYYTR
ncbi:hypothetical protein ACFQ3P_30060 [Paraburkholderia sabiae]|uniref:Uncharacterized protein n=1 Tax=Paraburkholderia sabiae TaxID=273251 RepID=A0ABU9QHJ6_9BURK|nr:hypothetical protein [Paraburkholderia sabiae]WJZ75648.1 hypothetical protein QEN71_07555 [Paraburkholderia sabiae]CAD6557620.1 hypothetical protein LMG24235_06187 [Paraburkholderia sabiae]